MVLTKEAKEILSVEKNKIHLCYVLNVSYATMHRWLRDNSEKLTMVRVINAMVEITGLTEDEIFDTVENES
jgi:hypothetical protein